MTDGLGVRRANAPAVTVTATTSAAITMLDASSWGGLAMDRPWTTSHLLTLWSKISRCR